MIHCPCFLSQHHTLIILLGYGPELCVHNKNGIHQNDTLGFSPLYHLFRENI